LYKVILDSIAVGVFTVNTQFIITSFNQEAERLTGFCKEEAMGRFCYEIFRADKCYTGCALQTAIENKARVTKERVTILDKNNNELLVEITTSALLGKEGNFIGGVESFIDDSERYILESKIQEHYSFHSIVSKDEKILQLLEVMPALAASDTAILLLGETGTGKDLFAKAILNLSHRKEGPFVKVNCAALPEHLLESELFGYQKGAFTDAKSNKPGRFQLAHQGTLFLDEIGDLPLPLQAKLLQALEDKEFFPLGATQPIRVDTRIIASTHRDLPSMVDSGKFRADLYYRLKVAVMHISPLRERKSDIPLLIDYFCKEICALQHLHRKTFSNQSREVLLKYSYPGNIRELKNILEYAVLIESDEIVHPGSLPQYVWEEVNQNINIRKSSIHTSENSNILQDSVQKTEKERLKQALTACYWRKDMTAAYLGISRTTLWRRMKKYDLLP